MAEVKEQEPVTDASAGHLSVHIGDRHGPEVQFLFERQSQRLAGSFATSFAIDVAIVALLIFAPRFLPQRASTPAVLPEEVSARIIWLNQPGPGGGGGGGGNKMKPPPRPAELPGRDKITVPVSKPVQIEPLLEPRVEPVVLEQVNIPAKNLAASTESLPGAIDVPTGPPTLSQGSGSGGGAGTGTGSGIGSGTGSGLGPGSGGGTGGGVYQPGNGVSLPRLVTEVKPAYTSDAMRAKIQGVVKLQCVVRPDGSVSDIQVVRSLDPLFGLDQEAVKAARRWRFVPGTRMGQPVAVFITIEMEFALR